jgi:hypothetical protein
MLADLHYSRQTVGSKQFMPPGRTIVIRDNEGLLVFGWLHQQYRDDGQEGFNCCIFRNESNRLSSSVILECEGIARDIWGMDRAFTYINPSKLRTLKCHGAEFCRWPPGRCFLEAGWKLLPDKSKGGLHLLEKFV